MVSITLGIPEYKLDGSRPYNQVVKEAIEQQAARDNRAKTSPEDLAIGREIKDSVPSSIESVGSSAPPAPVAAAAPAASAQVGASPSGEAPADAPTPAPTPEANFPPELGGPPPSIA